MQTFTTNRGTKHSINWILTTARNANRLAIDLKDDRALSEIAADFEDLEVLTKTDDNKQGVTEVYQGYSQLVSIQRNSEAGTVRLMLERRETDD